MERGHGGVVGLDAVDELPAVGLVLQLLLGGVSTLSCGTLNFLLGLPALSAILLKPHDAPKDRLTRIIDAVFGELKLWHVERQFPGVGVVGRVLSIWVELAGAAPLYKHLPGFGGGE